MLLISIILQLLSTSVNTIIHLAIWYSKSLIASLFILSFLSYNTLYLDNLNKPIGIFGGLFHISTLNTFFNLFIFLIGLVIVFLTAYYPRKVLSENVFYNIEAINLINRPGKTEKNLNTTMQLRNVGNILYPKTTETTSRGKELDPKSSEVNLSQEKYNFETNLEKLRLEAELINSASSELLLELCNYFILELYKVRHNYTKKDVGEKLYMNNSWSDYFKESLNELQSMAENLKSNLWSETDHNFGIRSKIKLAGKNYKFQTNLDILCLEAELINSAYSELLQELSQEKYNDTKKDLYEYFWSFTDATVSNNISNTTDEKYKISEYSLIILFIITGGVFLMASSDVISVFLSIELQSYGLYILCTIYRNSESSTSAGLTYFLLGGLASCFILLSTSLLYANSGCTSLENFYIIAKIYESLDGIHTENCSEMISWYGPYYLYISLIILSIGFLFKISASPFHFWSPDVYDGVPTIVTTFISILPKITIFIFILDLMININIYDYSWNSIFIISSLLSLVVGTVLGLTQHRIKRLYAYSTISHIGFLLLAMTNKTRESTQAFLFYLTQYSLSNLNAFFILIGIGYTLYTYTYNQDSEKEKSVEKTSHNKANRGPKNNKEVNNSPIQLIDQLKGYFYVNSFLSISLAITLFSFAGIPPLIGFFAKLMVLSASIDNGYVFMSIIAILTSVIGGAYYLLIISKIFFESSIYSINTHVKRLLLSMVNTKSSNSVKSIALSSALTIIISILTSIILLFIFIPSECLNFLLILSMILLNY